MLYYYYTNVNNEATEGKHEQYIPFLNNSLCTWDTYATRGLPEKERKKKKGKRKKKREERNNTRREETIRDTRFPELPATHSEELIRLMTS